MTKVKTTCSICEAKVVQIDAHIKRKHSTTTKENPLTCKFCDYQSIWRSVLDQHVNTTHLNVKWQCSICLMEFTSKHGHQLHLFSVHQVETKGLKIFHCSVCAYSTARQQDYNRHLITHEEKSKTFECSICHKKFSSNRLLQTHDRRMHNDRENRRCNLCGKDFARPCDLQNHIDVIHLGIDYKCEICQKAFKRKHLLKAHKDDHHSTEVHQCDQCPYTNGSKRQLVWHKRNMHDKKRRWTYICTICDSSFEKRQALSRHIRYQHMNSEQKAENKCKLCKKSFSRPSRLKNHVFVVHMGNLHKCDICHQEFTDKVNLKKHKENTHSSDI